MTQDMITLGFDQIIEKLKEQAVSQAAREQLAETEPILNESLCMARMEETTAARKVIENAGTPPLTETDGAETGLVQAAQGVQVACAQEHQNVTLILRRHGGLPVREVEKRLRERCQNLLERVVGPLVPLNLVRRGHEVVAHDVRVRKATLPHLEHGCPQAHPATQGLNRLLEPVHA